MSYPITPAPAIHNASPATATAQENPIIGILRNLITQIPEIILSQVIQFIKEITGVDLSSIFDGLDITNPGAVLAAIEAAVQTVITGALQQVIDDLVGGLTGTTTTGNDPTAITLALINQALALPGQFLAQILGSLASLQGQVTAIQNNPTGASQTDDFGAASVATWTNVLGTLLVSANGPYVQAASTAAAYIGTTGTPRKPATDRHGVQIVVDAKMRGAVRLWIAGNAAMSNYAALEVYSGIAGDAMRISTGAAPSLTVVQQQVDVIDSRLPNLTTFDIKYDPAANNFIALRNGQSVGLSWVDSTNIVTHGSTKRFVGVVSNALNGSVTGTYGFGIKKVTFYDW